MPHPRDPIGSQGNGTGQGDQNTPAPADDFSFDALFSSSAAPASDDASDGGQNDSQIDDSGEGAAAGADAGNGNAGETPDGEPSERALLQQQLQSQQDMLSRVMQALTERAAPPAPAPTPAPQGPKFNYAASQIPQEITSRLISEDPAERVAGMTMLMSAVANHIFKSVEEHVQTTYQPQFTQLVSTQLAQYQAQEAFKNEFTAAYPQLSATDEGRTVARIVMEQAVQDLVSAGTPKERVSWGPQLKAAFDKRIQALKQGGRQQAPANGGAPRQIPRAKVVTRTPGLSDEAQQMMEVLNAF